MANREPKIRLAVQYRTPNTDTMYIRWPKNIKVTDKTERIFIPKKHDFKISNTT